MRFVVAGTKEIVPDDVRRVLEEHGYQVLAIEDEPAPEVAGKQALARTAVIELQPGDSAERRPTRERALTDSDERLRTAVAAAQVGTWHWEIASGELLWSEGCAEIFGERPERRVVSYEYFLSAIHPADRERVAMVVQRALREHADVESEYRIVQPGGAVRWLFARGRVLENEARQPVRIEGVVVDMTAQREAESALLESERKFRGLAEAVPHLLWQVAPSGELLYSNRRNREYFGKETISFEDWRSVHHPDDYEAQLASYAHCVSSREPTGPTVHRLRSKEGTYRWFASYAVPVSNEHGELECVIGTSTDVSDLKRAEQELRDAQERLLAALQAAGMGTWRFDPSVGRMELDDALLALHGYTREEAGVLGTDAAALLIHEDDRELALRTMSEALERGSDFTLEVRALHKSGAPFWIRTRGRIQSDDGTARMVGASVEITRQKVLEEQLRHAQKMEAIGQLAGGVAHDFNNMLTIIAGRVSLLELAATHSDEMEESLRDIGLATERAASLTAQLLAFASRQVLRKRDLDLNAVVTNVVRMLARTLGEQIEIVFKPADRAVVIHADEGMMTQVLLNLAVNARDAMPRGGTLTITTQVVSDAGAGATANGEQVAPHALLQVRDTGEGMSPAVLEHMFEPFFTTKPVGKGTGLGLATVYGIVTQHRGSITVDSAPGAGTTFFVRFPLETTPASEAPEARPSTRGEGETVLLVEDEPSVCRLVQRMLEANGYRVIAVDTGAAAIAAFEASSGRVDLLLTDMVLRGNMTGRELLERLRAMRPSLRALLTSGYSIELATNEPGPIHAVPFLRKPFNAEELLRAVRDALARSA